MDSFIFALMRERESLCKGFLHIRKSCGYLLTEFLINAEIKLISCSMFFLPKDTSLSFITRQGTLIT